MAATLACTQSPNDAPPDTAPRPAGTAAVRPEYDEAGTLRKIEYDRNGDGRVDTWGYMDGARVLRVDTDDNGDGVVDRWEYHRPDAPGNAGRALQGGVDATVERIECATRFDGHVSRWEHFTEGALARVEEDTDGDGKVDKWETYANGSLSVTALDTLGRGIPDRRLVYRPDGTLDHIEADATGTGTFTPIRP